MSLLEDEDGLAHADIHTEWSGWADNERKIELRVPSVVNATRMVEFWSDLSIHCCVINSIEDCILFMLAGGPGIVEIEVSKRCFERFWNPAGSVRTGPSGFTSSKQLDKNTFLRAPSPKKRMKVLNRDNRKCRICGRSPERNSDIELHIHHIRPWSLGGLSNIENLVTLCHTCHNGLEPHYDASLFHFMTNLPKGMAEYRESVLLKTRNFRKHSFFQND